MLMARHILVTIASMITEAFFNIMGVKLILVFFLSFDQVIEPQTHEQVAENHSTIGMTGHRDHVSAATTTTVIIAAATNHRTRPSAMSEHTVDAELLQNHIILQRSASEMHRTFVQQQTPTSIINNSSGKSNKNNNNINNTITTLTKTTQKKTPNNYIIINSHTQI